MFGFVSPAKGWVSEQLLEFISGGDTDPPRGIDQSLWEAPAREELTNDGLLELTGFFQDIAFIFATILLIGILFTIATQQRRGIASVKLLVKFIFGLAIIANSTTAILLLYSLIDSIIITIQAVYIEHGHGNPGSKLIGLIYMGESVVSNPLIYSTALIVGWISDQIVRLSLFLRQVVLSAFVPAAPLLALIWMIGSTLDYKLPGLDVFFRSLFFPIPLIIFLSVAELLMAPGARLAPDLSHATNQLIISVIMIILVWTSIKMSGVTSTALGTAKSAAGKGAFVGAAAATGGAGLGARAAIGGPMVKGQVINEAVENAPGKVSKTATKMDHAASKIGGRVGNIINNPANAQGTNSADISGFAGNQAIRPGGGQQGHVAAEGMNPQDINTSTKGPYKASLENLQKGGVQEDVGQNGPRNQYEKYSVTGDIRLGDTRDRETHDAFSDETSSTETVSGHGSEGISPIATAEGESVATEAEDSDPFAALDEE